MALHGRDGFGRRDAKAPGGRAPVGVPAPQPSAPVVPAGVLAAIIVAATALLDPHAAGPTLIVTFVIVMVVLRRDVGAFFAARGAGKSMAAFALPRGVALIAAAILAVVSYGPSIAAQGMTVSVAALSYLVIGRGFEAIAEFGHAANALRTARRRSRWFVIGAIAGAAFFLINDQTGWVPLSLSEAMGIKTDAAVETIEKSGILPQLNSTFSYTKDGFQTHPPAGPGAPGVSETEWQRMKAWIALTEGASWYIDLIAIAAAAGFLFNTIMVRFLGFADTGDIKSDD